MVSLLGGLEDTLSKIAHAPLSPPPIDGVPIGVCRGSVDSCRSQTFTSVSNLHIVLRTIHRIRVSRLSTWVSPLARPCPAGYGSVWTAPVPVAFRPLAFASRTLLHPLRTSAFLTVGLLTAEPSDPIGVSTFRMMERRSGWVPSVRRGLGARAGDRTLPRSKWPNIVVSSIVFDNHG